MRHGTIEVADVKAPKEGTAPRTTLVPDKVGRTNSKEVASVGPDAIGDGAVNEAAANRIVGDAGHDAVVGHDDVVTHVVQVDAYNPTVAGYNGLVVART